MFARKEQEFLNLNIIVAVNADWGIGFKGRQTIAIKEDRQFFKSMTTGGVVIAGRKTFDAIGLPLPNRKNIILAKSEDFNPDGVVVRRDINEILAEINAEPPEKVFVIGGESVYRAFLPFCEYAYVTKIEAKPESDTFFPNLDEHPDWVVEKIIRAETIAANMSDKSENLRYSIALYRNKQFNREDRN